jgi:hypothetical protein
MPERDDPSALPIDRAQVHWLRRASPESIAAMNAKTLTLLTTAVLALAPAAAPAAEHVYDVTFVGGGEYHHTWQRVINDTVERTESDLRFSWETTYEGVTFRDGHLVEAVEDIVPEVDVNGTEVQHYRDSDEAYTVRCEPDGEDTDLGAGMFAHGAELEAEEVVLRPAARLARLFRCAVPYMPGEWTHLQHDMQAPAVTGEQPILGAAPLDAVFELPPEAIGAGKVIQQVSSADKPSDCPARDPDHTISCTIAWTGEVVMVRRDPKKPVLHARVDRGARRVVLQVRCDTSCRGRAEVRLTDGSGRRRTVARVPFAARPGRTTTITRRLDPRAWRMVSRGGVIADARVL